MYYGAITEGLVSAVKLINCWPGLQIDLSGRGVGADSVAVQVLAACTRVLSMLELFVERFSLDVLGTDEFVHTTVIIVIESLKATCRLLVLYQPQGEAGGDTPEGEGEALMLLNWGNSMQASAAGRHVSSLSSYRRFHRETLRRRQASEEGVGLYESCGSPVVRPVMVMGGSGLGSGSGSGGTVTTYIGRRSGLMLKSPPPCPVPNTHPHSPTGTNATSSPEDNTLSVSHAGGDCDGSPGAGHLLELDSSEEYDEFRSILVDPPPRQSRSATATATGSAPSTVAATSPCEAHDRCRGGGSAAAGCMTLAVGSFSVPVPVSPEQLFALAEVLYVLRPVVYAACLRTFCTDKARRTTPVGADASTGGGVGSGKEAAAGGRRELALLLAVLAELVLEGLSIRMTELALHMVRDQLERGGDNAAGAARPVVFGSRSGSRGDYRGRQFPVFGQDRGRTFRQGGSALHEMDTELRRRKLMLLWYLVKAPVFGRATAPLLRLVERYLSMLPVVNQLPSALLGTLTWANQFHFRTSHS